MVLKVDQSEIQLLAQRLERVAERSVPFAVRNTLNRSAFAGRKKWQAELRKEFTLRNKFTERSVRVDKARGLRVSQMQATLGSTQQYLADQETGATIRKRGKHGVSIPTSVASGEGRGARPRKRKVRRPNMLGRIQLDPRVSGSRKRRNAAAISQAIKSGRKFVFLDLERRKGIFKIAGGKRRPRLDMIWDLTKPSVRLRARPTLERTISKMEPIIRNIYVGALKEQLKRNGFT